MMATRRAATIGFAILGLAVVGWWLLLALLPASRRLFFPRGEFDLALRALALPDLLLLGAGSLLVAELRRRRARSAAAGSWLLAGAWLYAALFTLLWWALTAAPLLSPLLMAGAALVALGCARVAV